MKMTETDATKRPLEIPDSFIPYLEKHRLLKLFKDMIQDLVLNMPEDHLQHMKEFLNHRRHSKKDIDKVVVLLSPELVIDRKRLIQDVKRMLGCLVITRRCVMDRYEKHEEYVPSCISLELMSAITKTMTLKPPVPEAGWLMFDHPCTIREARCLQQAGVLPTVTLVVQPPPTLAPTTPNHHTTRRGFFDQDFDGLKLAYRATLKEVNVNPDDNQEAIARACVTAIRAASSGAQGPGQGYHMVGAPSVYRVLLIGARGSGRRTQAKLAAQHFGLVYLNFETLLQEAEIRKDEIGEKLRNMGVSVQIKAEIVRRRITQRDCIDHGWVMVGYPELAIDFEFLDKMPTPANRVIILNVEYEECRARTLSRAVDWCTGEEVPLGSGPRARPLYKGRETKIDAEYDTFFAETLAELRAAAGFTVVEIDGSESIDEVQVKVQAAIMAAPTFNIEYSSQLRNVRGD
ncbi:adenylate kinase 8-like [Aricia agestis]|uniref:adenylate kinase 8-like n=1 Tax=Aricia agestis TaxID=91739 RepID=UPI001C209AA8|nr:adenylate kinase 8-like [Aricia agestis]